MAPSYIYRGVPPRSPGRSDRAASKDHPPPTRSFGTHHPWMKPLFPGRPRASDAPVHQINNGSQKLVTNKNVRPLPQTPDQPLLVLMRGRTCKVWCALERGFNGRAPDGSRRLGPVMGSTLLLHHHHTVPQGGGHRVRFAGGEKPLFLLSRAHPPVGADPPR